MSTNTQAAGENPDAYLFLSILHHMKPDGKPDWESVARDIGHAYAKNVPTKFNSVAKKFGYKYERGAFILLSDTADTTVSTNATAISAPATPKTLRKRKAAGKKGNSGDVTPASAKKRKVERITAEESDEEVESNHKDQD